MDNKLINFLFNNSKNAEKVKDLIIQSFIENNPYDKDRISTNLINLLTSNAAEFSAILLKSNDINKDKLKEIIKLDYKNLEIIDINITFVDNILNKVYCKFTAHPYKYYKDANNELDYKFYSNDEYNIAKLSTDINNYSTNVDYKYHPEVLKDYKEEKE